jgi:hypothetical protein
MSASLPGDTIDPLDNAINAFLGGGATQNTAPATSGGSGGASAPATAPASPSAPAAASGVPPMLVVGGVVAALVAAGAFLLSKHLGHAPAAKDTKK